MARKGKIDELYDLPKIEAQQDKVVAYVQELIDTIGKVRPIALKLEGAEKVKEVIDGVKQVSQATQQVAEVSAKTNAVYKELLTTTEKASEAFRKQKEDLSQLGTSLNDNLKRQLEYKIRLSEVKKALTELESFKGIGGDEGVKIKDQIAALTKEQYELQDATSDVTKTIKAQIKEINSSAGSIDIARAKLQQLRKERNNLDLTTESGQAQKDALNQQIDLLDEFIKKNVDAYTQQKINIGNYQGSAKIIVEALAEVEKKIESLKQKQQGLVDLSNKNPTGFKLGNQASELNQVNAQLETAQKEFQALNTIAGNPQFLNVASKVGDANAELKQFTKTLIDLERQGLGNTDFANELRGNLAELKDQIEDTRQEIKAMSSDSRAFDQLASSINFLANTYQTVVGVQALFGDQNEATEETIKKLVAVQSIANGLQQISQQLTERGTLVNKAFTFVQTQYAIATDRSAAATLRLSAATKLLGIGLAIGAIAAVVYYLNKWSSEASKIVTQQKVLNDVTRAAADSYGKEKAQLDVLIATIKTEGLSRKEKFAALKELQEKYPGYFDNIKTEKDLNEKLAEAYQKASQGILLKAQAQAAGDLLAQNSAKRLEAEIDLAERIGQINATFKAGGGADAPESFKKQLAAQRKLAAEQFKAVVDPLDKTNQHLIQSIQDANSAIKQLGGKPIKEDTFKTIESDLKSVFELRKKYLQDQIDLQKSISEMEGLNEAVRVDARKKQLNLERILLKEETDFEIAQVDLKQRTAEAAARKEIKNAADLQNALKVIASNAAAERALIRKNSTDKEVDIETNALADIIAIRKNANDQLKQAAEETEAALNAGDKSLSDKRVQFLKTVLDERLQNIQNSANAELKIELDKYTKGKINKEQYEEAKAKIETEAHRKAILAQIAFYEDMIRLANLAPDAEKDALKQLQEYRQQLYDLDVKAQEEANEKKAKSNQGFFKKYKEQLTQLGTEVQEAFFSVLEGGADRQKNQVQEQIDALEEQKAKDIEVVNQTVTNKQEAADQIAVIEARANAKKEQLEKRQRQLDEQKARFERAKAVVGIIQNTAQAVTAALPNLVLAAIVGAIGAAQLVSVLARPIPKYALGTEDHPGGFAIVGDGKKKEYIQTPDGSVYETPATDTVLDLPKHSKVFKDEFALMDAMHRQHVSTASRAIEPRPNDYYQFQNMTNEIKGMRKDVVKAIKNIPQPIIQAPNKVKDWVHSNGSTHHL